MARVTATQKTFDNLFCKALGLVNLYHFGQKDKSGKPYFFHLLRVAMVFEKQYMLESKKQDLILIGLLHDLIEDTNFELDNLYHFDFPKRVIEGVDAMTRRVNESYQEYLVRCKQNPLARQVKIEDLKDNMSVERKYEPLAEWKSLMKRYEKSLAFMEKED